jgi:hypothetical protein
LRLEQSAETVTNRTMHDNVGIHKIGPYQSDGGAQ